VFALAEILISFLRMCGRYRRTASEEELARLYQNSDPEADGTEHPQAGEGERRDVMQRRRSTSRVLPKLPPQAQETALIN
jgi:hypothetical protein